jgi:hypothetical protein
MAVFINYRREDSDGDTRAIYNRLAEETDASNLFLDVEAIGAGENWRTRIDNMLQKVNAVVVVIGPRWLELLNARTAAGAFDSVRVEIAASLNKPNVQVIPVLVSGARLPAQGALPEDMRGLTDLNAIEVRGSAWTSDVERLVKALHKSGALPTSPARWIARAAALAAVPVVVLAVVIAFFELRREVPNLPKNMSYRFARELVSNAGLKLVGHKIEPRNGTINVVSVQRPPAGSHLFAGQSVEVDLVAVEPYQLVCREGQNFAYGSDDDGFRFEQYKGQASIDMTEGSCAWIDRSMRQEEANVLKPLGFERNLAKHFHSAPGGLLAFCAISDYDKHNKSPRLLALSLEWYARKEGSGQLVPIIGDYMCVDRLE